MSSRPKRAKTSRGKQAATEPDSRVSTFDPLNPTFRNAASSDTFHKFEENGREIKPTKFLHRPSMTDLGLLDGLEALFSSIGWSGFLHLNARTYEVPTKEFLATFPRDDISRVLGFRLQGRPFCLNYADLNEFMGCPTTGLVSHGQEDPAHVIEAVRLWETLIGNQGFYPNRSKAADILSPHFRVAHRILSSSIFGRIEPGSIFNSELFILWCMTQQDDPRPCFVSYFLEKCSSINKQHSGDIYIGGLITALGLRLGLQFYNPPYPPVPGPHLLNLSALKRMGAIRDFGDGTYVWIRSDPVRHYVLPCARVSTLSPHDPATWAPHSSFDALGNLIPEDGGEPEPEPQQVPGPQFQFQHQQGGPELPPYFPATFFTDFASLTTNVQYIRERIDQQSLDLQDLRDRQSRSERRIDDM
ncbi:hypothetical protein LXL04_017327 [Taraxacum kok-saghyz]